MNKDKHSTSPRSTNYNHSADRRTSNDKKEVKVGSKLKCGDIGIDCIIKYK